MQNTIIEQAPKIVPVLADSNGFWIQVVLATITAAAVIVALFQEKIKDWFNKAKLSVEIRPSPPDCHQIDLSDQNGKFVSKSIYIRIRVTNESDNKIAKNIEIIASNLWKIDGRKKEIVKWFLPMNLVWAHDHPITVSIPPKSFRLCDLGAFRPLFDGNTRFRFDTMVQPNPVSGGHIPNIIEEGKYLFEAITSGENVKPETIYWEIEFKKDWSDDEDRMLENIKIHKISK
ncbi:MAG: hypothetical protein M1511_12565 [Deltaproteobacteria bacterium]|nr:hypothetical protein [Deltaproteobacteria bacterium]